MNDLSRRKFLSLTAQGMIVSAFLPTALQAAMNSGNVTSTEVKNVNQFQNDPNACISRMKLFTDTYKKYTNASTALREVECMKVQYPLQFCDIQPEDLFAGRDRKPVLSFLPQSAGFGYYLEDSGMKSLLDNPILTPENKQIANELVKFWSVENSVQKTRNSYPESLKQVLASEAWMTEPIIAAPLYRMSGTQCDFDKLIRMGIPGLRNEIASYKSKAAKGSESYLLYEGMEKALDLFGEVAIYYADMTVEQAKTASEERKKELLVMEKVPRFSSFTYKSPRYSSIRP